MGAVEPFSEAHHEAVADLHRRIFNTADRLTPEILDEYRTYFTAVFRDNPWRDENLPSLVHREDSGDITGFLGVVPRSFTLRKEPATAVVATQFIVDPEARSGMVGLKLLKTLFGGPQDLTFADEANDDSRLVWEGIKGATSLLYSVHWTRPLRPLELASRFASERGRLAVLGSLSRPLSRAIDSAVVRARGTQFHMRRPSVVGEDADAGTLVDCVGRFGARRALLPTYDAASMQWTLDRLDGLVQFGRLHKVLVRDAKNKAIGCYVYYLNPGGMGEVLQMSARPQHAPEVFDHLSYHAWERGQVALIGRLVPEFMRPVSNAYCLFQRARPWMLIQARDPAVLGALHQGDCHLSRLDGEFTFRFR